ncbi:hypothetical protein Q7P37_003697 [Cladosporium fusiforme]
MDQDKPFKTIEVIDGRTNQVCKIACMSCIRGHRTTSCGIPVCRQKIFWTVKRPGRPSNSCTCRYGATGGCKCVTAIPKCPHKSKKGEKRSSECRCDEQGRFCCLLEPEHWDVLFKLQKPTIDFYPSRDALEGGQTAQTPMTIPNTPAYYPESAPQRVSSCCGTPGPQPQQPQQVPFPPTPYSDMMSPKSSVTTRFGFMGLGGPMGSAENAPPDPMAWNGSVPPTPHDYSAPPDALNWTGTAPPAPSDYGTPTSFQQPQAEKSSCCSGPATQLPHYQEPEMEIEENSCCQSSEVPLEAPQDFSLGDPYLQNSHLNPFEPAITQPPYEQPYVQPAFDFERWTQEYQAYQYPGAICQKCGLNGCTCRNCPPVMQNFGTTSWAQCCGRKHARQGPQRLPPHSQPQIAPTPMAQFPTNGHPLTHQPPVDFGYPAQHTPQQQHMDMHLMSSPPPQTQQHMNGFDHNFDMPDATDPVAYSDFLLSELDRPSHSEGQNGFG